MLEGAIVIVILLFVRIDFVDLLKTRNKEYSRKCNWCTTLLSKIKKQYSKQTYVCM